MLSVHVISTAQAFAFDTERIEYFQFDPHLYQNTEMILKKNKFINEMLLIIYTKLSFIINSVFVFFVSGICMLRHIIPMHCVLFFFFHLYKQSCFSNFYLQLDVILISPLYFHVIQSLFLCSLLMSKFIHDISLPSLPLTFSSQTWTCLVLTFMIITKFLDRHGHVLFLFSWLSLIFLTNMNMSLFSWLSLIFLTNMDMSFSSFHDEHWLSTAFISYLLTWQYLFLNQLLKPFCWFL